MATITQHISISDEQTPIFSDIPIDITVDCNAIPVPTITATDGCDEEVEVVFEETTTGSCPFQIIRTWTAISSCQSTATITQHITVRDDQAPVFNDMPRDITVDCSAVPIPTCLLYTSPSPRDRG